MGHHKSILLVTAAVFVTAVGLALWFKEPRPVAVVPTDQLVVTALDVGQGDAILLRTPRGDDVLIDGGPNAGVVRRIEEHLPPSDRTIELVVLTHPDLDHVGGLPAVARSYRIERVLETAVRGSSRAAREWEAALAAEGAAVTIAKAGTQIDLGAVQLRVLWPEGDLDSQTKNRNDTSVVIETTYGQTRLLFPGDISSTVEARLVATGTLDDVDLLKVPHHGSSSSSSAAFLDAVQPEFAIISVGRDNRYGHPHAAVLRRYDRRGASLYRTDEQGDMTVVSDGKSLRVAP